MARTKTEAAHKTKATLVRDLLDRPEGARIEELCKATGWQAHTVRAALSRLRKTGVGISRTPDAAGNSAYRVDGSEAAGR